MSGRNAIRNEDRWTMGDLAEQLNRPSVNRWDLDFAKHCFRNGRMDQFVSGVDARAAAIEWVL